MLSTQVILLRLALAVLLGGAIGWERERHDKAAGLRTHMLVCIGSALIMIVSAYGFNEVLGREATGLDPSRVAAQVVSGIGFLGVGIIIFRRDLVVGLTTAAGVWAVAGVGLAVGGGLYFAAAATTVLAVIVNTAARPLESWIRRGHRQYSLSVVVDRKTPLIEIENAITNCKGVCKSLQVDPGDDPANYNVSIIVASLPADQEFAVVEQLKKIEGVHKIDLEKYVDSRTVKPA